MKKTYRLKNLDCANCAAKMERSINKIDGISSAAVSFMSSRLTVEADESRFESIIDETARVIKRIEPNCIIER